MNLLLIILCVVFCVSLLFLVITLAVAGIRSAGRRRTGGNNNQTYVFLAIAIVFLSVFFLRPHEETFQGLDSSAYRLMAKSVIKGRPLNGEDSVLKSLPLELRKWVLLSPYHNERLTRDRSFEISSLDNCDYKPFFYPLLPFCQIGMGLLAPGESGLDFFVPVMGLIMAIALVAIGAALGGVVIGGGMAVVLLVGSPLVVWLMRGAYLESVSGVLLCMAITPWLIEKNLKPSIQYLQFFALGMATSFHPVMAVLSIPLAGVFLVWESSSIRFVISRGLALAAGLLPIFLLSLFICAPYGNISLKNFQQTLIHSASIRPAFLVLLGLIFLVFLGQVLRGWIVKHLSTEGWRHYAWSAVFLAIWILPMSLAVKYWEHNQGRIVLRGFNELLIGLQWPLGLLTCALCVLVLFHRSAHRAKIVLSLVFLSLPLFCYLKGAEQMGLWSQRRLIVSYLVIAVCGLVVGSECIRCYLRKSFYKKSMQSFCLVFLVIAGLYNPLRWPAPYIVRFDRGASRWVAHIEKIIGNKLTVFDYHPFSVPFSVKFNKKVIGLSEKGYDGWPDIINWLQTQSTKEDVLLVAAYANPGLEDGVVLKKIRSESVRFPRAHSKHSLPAVFRDRVIEVEFAQIIPITDADRSSLAVHKVFDRGPLALRGAWGRADIHIRLEEGKILPAQWSRQGSGIIGPIPNAGGIVEISLTACSGRKNVNQELLITPPWGGDPLSLLVSDTAAESRGVIQMPKNVSSFDFTGTYTINTKEPYNPREEGIKGFDSDLGALIHSIKIELKEK